VLLLPLLLLLLLLLLLAMKDWNLWFSIFGPISASLKLGYQTNRMLELRWCEVQN